MRAIIIVVMENNKKLQEEIVGAVRDELGLFKVGMHDELGTFKVEIHEELGSFKSELQGELGLFKAEIKGEMNNRFDEVDKGLNRLEVMMEDMDDKFTLISEGQDIIRDVLEVRVSHIEQILGIGNS